MKRTILLFTALLALGKLQAQQAVPYNENFETFTAFTTPGGGWQGGFQVYSTHGVGSSKGLIKNLNNFTTKDSTTSPKIGVVTATSYVKFDYRFVEVSLYPSFSYMLAAGDYLKVQAAGSSGTYTTLATIDMNNHTTATAFKTDSVSLSQFAGDSIRVRFKVQRGSAGDYFVDIDNLAVTGEGSIPSGINNQPAATSFSPFPNPSNGRISFKLNNTTLPVNLSMVNMLGQTVYYKPIAGNNGLYTAADLNLTPGLYIAKVNYNNTTLVSKVYIAQ